MNKLIYIATSVIPAKKANALQVMKTCEAFKKIGIEIELIIPVRFGNVRVKIDPFDYYQIKNKERFKITKIFSFDLIPLEKIIGRLGFYIQNISFAIFTASYLFFRKNEIYYARDILSAFILVFIKKNVFYEVHRLPKSSFNRLIFKCLLLKISGLIVIAEELKEIIMEKFTFDVNKIVVAHDGVDIEQFNNGLSKKMARQKLKWPIDKKIICYTGSLQYVKGIDTLISAVNLLPAVYCYIIGDYINDIEKNKNLYQTKNKQVIFLGLQPHNLIPTFLKAADVLIIPHRDLAFSFSPLKLFEYMASKRPIISSQIKILINILGKDGAVYFKADDSKDLAEKIKLTLANQDLNQKMIDKTFLMVQNYSWFNRSKIIINFIIKLI